MLCGPSWWFAVCFIELDFLKCCRCECDNNNLAQSLWLSSTRGHQACRQEERSPKEQLGVVGAAAAACR